MASIDPRIGSELAGYRIESVLGRGGMSVVYLAEDQSLHRRVALKVLAPDLARDERFRSRFIRESEMAAGIDHPNIVPIYQAGEADGLLFIAMRYIRGSDLKTVIELEGRLDSARATSIVRQAANALDAAHAQGLVHRDVKPANLLLAPGPDPEQPDQVYLSDFGLTKRPTSRSGLTNTGQFIGTVDYMAPEQIEGKTIDGRVDVYSLGCVLYECLTGDVPYPKDNEVAVIYAHLQQAPPSVAAIRPDLPPEIDEVIAQAMAKDPDGRYATCGAMAKALRSVLAPSSAPELPVSVEAPPARGPATPAPARRPSRGRPWWRQRVTAVAAVVVIAVAAGAVVLLTRSGGSTPGPSPPGIAVPRGLALIDPSSNRVVARVPYEGACCVTLVQGTVWAGGNDEVVKVSPITNQVVATIPHVYRPLSWGNELWGFANGAVRIDPNSNRIVRQVSFVNLGFDGAAIDHRALWMISSGNQAVLEVDKRTGKELGRIPISVGGIDGTAAGDGALWITDKANSTVLRIDARTHVVKEVPVHHPSGIAIAPGGVWIVDALDGILTELSRDGGAVLATVNLHMAQGNQDAAIAVGPDAIWVTDTFGGQLIRVDLFTHQVVARITVGPGPDSVAADANDVWITR
jgi:serine/threonine protein kinase